METAVENLTTATEVRWTMLGRLFQLGGGTAGPVSTSRPARPFNPQKMTEPAVSSCGLR
jgi:hypothetical protein